MKSKNTDRIFRERLEGFKQEPDAAVWDRINKSLDHKKKRKRIIPIWWRFAGAAAIVLLAVYLLSPDTEAEQELPSVTNSDTEARPGSADPQSDTELPPVLQKVVTPQEIPLKNQGKSTGLLPRKNKFHLPPGSQKLRLTRLLPRGGNTPGIRITSEKKRFQKIRTT